MLSLQPHPPPTLICHGLYGDILQVSPVAYSYLVAKYQMSSGPYGHFFFLCDLSNSFQNLLKQYFIDRIYIECFYFYYPIGLGGCWGLH